MKKELKTILYIAFFVIFLVAAGFAYNFLAERYKPENRFSKDTIPQTQNQEPDTSKPAVTVAPNSNDTQTPNITTASPSSSPEDTDKRVKAPDFTVYDRDGHEVKLSDFLGTPVVLNFWASWCPPCVSEMPDFDKVAKEYPDDVLQFLMVDLVDGQRETVETGSKFVDEKGFGFKVLYATQPDAAYTYGVRSIPTTYLIDAEGYIVTGAEGALDEEILRLGISMILEDE